jgi:transcriptional antiterminator NusG
MKNTVEKEIEVNPFENLIIQDPNNENLKWYLVQVQSNCEKKAINNININLGVESLEKKVKDVFFPYTEVTENKNGKKRKKIIKLYPGYIMIFADMDLSLYSAVTRASKVTGFLSKRASQPLPSAMLKKEVENVFDKIASLINNSGDLSKIKEGDLVLILSGNFTNFKGNVKSVNFKQSSVIVGLEIFGRETSITLNLEDVELTQNEN